MVQNLSSLSGMPQMGAAFAGWMKPLVLTKVTQSIVDALVVPANQVFNFRGTVQPLSPEEIALKPEGERSWQWLQIHVQTPTNLTLTTGDQIVYNTVLFKVMAVKDYSLNGYIEYHVVKDFQ